ncbi:MAG: NnrS family protein [Nitrosomonadales bacterium]|nr:NnrS family protein [Nitrosomonadales bacterium]
MSGVNNRWSSFTAAPHRVMFFGGALQVLAVMLWWLVELVTRSGMFGQALTWSIAPAAAHAWLMIYGLFPFFMFGFLMTTFPRWMAGTEIPARHYVPAFLLMLSGAGAFYIGLFTDAGMLPVAVLGMLAGWAMALYALLRVLLDTTHSDKRHPVVLFIALFMGWCGLASYAGWLFTDEARYLDISIQTGLWFFLLPVFATVGHRMIPFFTSSALPQSVLPRSYWPWWTMLAGSMAHGLLKLAGAGAWLWLGDLPLAVAALYLSHVWGFRRSFAVPLLAVLHVGFAWLGIAMSLFAVQSMLFAYSGGVSFVWGLAPLHALTIGCFATLIIGMGTRVTLGHSGLPMKVDGPIKLMFAGMQIVALLRVLADMLPAQFSYWFYVAAAAMWLVCFFPWVWRYLPAYWRPRADGQAG